MEFASLQQRLPGPFPEAISEGQFFGEPQRTQCLNFLLHLAPYSNELLVVTGDQGSGKTSLIKQFIAKASDGWKIYVVGVENSQTVSSFLREVSAGFEVQLQHDSTVPESIQAFTAQFQVLQKRGQRPILVIDDAHRLTEPVARFIDQLVDTRTGEENDISVIFFGEPSLNSSPIIDLLRHHGLHTFEIPPLGLEETTYYIRHHLTIAGLAADRFAASDIKKIHKAAQGNLTEINLAARELLAGATAPDSTPDQPIRSISLDEGPRSSILRWLVGGLVTGALLLALIFQDDINQLVQPSETESAPQEGPHKSVLPSMAEVPSEETRIPPVVDHDVGERAGGTRAEDSSFGFENRDGDGDENLDLAQEDVDIRVEDGIAAKEPIVVKEPLAVREPVEGSPQRAVPKLGEAVDAEFGADATVTGNDAAIAEAMTKPAMDVAEEQSAPVDQSETAPLTQQPDSTAQRSVDVDVSTTSSVKREAWLLDQDSQSYTLQLMALSNESGIMKLLEPLDSKADFAYYRYIRASGALFGLLYGLYPDREAAATASKKKMPAALGKVKPWIRKVGDIQAEIRRSEPVN